MTGFMLFSIVVLSFALFTYPKWDYKNYYKRSEINAKHPDWQPYCGRNFLNEDPVWFIENGYDSYVVTIKGKGVE